MSTWYTELMVTDAALYAASLPLRQIVRKQLSYRLRHTTKQHGRIVYAVARSPMMQGLRFAAFWGPDAVALSRSWRRVNRT